MPPRPASTRFIRRRSRPLTRGAPSLSRLAPLETARRSCGGDDDDDAPARPRVVELRSSSLATGAAVLRVARAASPK